MFVLKLDFCLFLMMQSTAMDKKQLHKCITVNDLFLNTLCYATIIEIIEKNTQHDLKNSLKKQFNFFCYIHWKEAPPPPPDPPLPLKSIILRTNCFITSSCSRVAAIIRSDARRLSSENICCQNERKNSNLAKSLAAIVQ